MNTMKNPGAAPSGPLSAKRRRLVGLAGTALAATLLWTAPVLAADGATGSTADGEPSEKEEVVYVMTDAAGSVRSIDVVNIFDTEGDGAEVLDYGEYSQVKMLTTNDAIEQDGDRVTFTTDAGRVYYQGTLDEAQIPWNISIRYFLDGEAVSADELAGASGRLEIRFSVTENARATGAFYDDYTLQASFTLDTERCTGIEAAGATVANVGRNKQLTYTVMKGKGISTSIFADVVDFEMDAVTINAVRMNMDVDLDLDSSTELKDATADITQAGADIDDGVADLQDGIAEAGEGAASLKDGLDTLNSKSSDLTGGAKTVFDALVEQAETSVNAGLAAAGLNKVEMTSENYAEVLGGLLDSIDAEARSQATAAAEQQARAQAEATVTQETRASIEGDADAMAIIASGVSAQYADQMYAEAQHAVAYALATQMSPDDPDTWFASDEGQYVIAQYLASDEGSAAVAEALPQVEAAYQQAALDQMVQKQLETDRVSQAIDEAVEEALASDDVQEQIDAAVADALAQNTAYQGIVSAKGQLDSFSEFYTGLLDYTTGVGDAASGAADLATGIGDLGDGAADLKDGTAEFRDSTSNLDAQLKDKISAAAEDMFTVDSDPASFVSDKNTNVTSVQFVIKTDAIEAEEPDESTEEEETSMSFLEKLEWLFRG